MGAAGDEPGAVGAARQVLLLGRDRELAQLDLLIEGVATIPSDLILRSAT